MSLSANNDPVARAVRCCAALNGSGLLRAEVSPRSDTGLRLRDLAGAGTPCTLVLYWGVWRHADLNDKAERLLGSIDSLVQTIAETLAIPTKCQLLFTDTHARLNGVPEAVIEAALARLQMHSRPSIGVRAMSELLPASARDPSIESAMAVAGADRLLDQLRRQAVKLFGAEAAGERAERYLCANLGEAPHVFAAWPDAIFVHLGPPELKVILPSMPLLYGYAGVGGVTRKPWFD